MLGMLQRHNYYRELVGVSSLVWSSDIANIAQAWAEQCTFGRRSNKKNLF